MHSHIQHITPHYIHNTPHSTTAPNSPFCCVQTVEPLLSGWWTKFNLDVSLVARLGGHSAPRTHRDHHLCFDSDGGEDCRKVRQGENDHQSTGDGVHQEWRYVFDECVDFCKKKTELLTRQVFDGNVLYGGEIIGILTLLFRVLPLMSRSQIRALGLWCPVANTSPERNQCLWVLGRVWSQAWNFKELTEGHHPASGACGSDLTQHGKTHQVQTQQGFTDW